MVSAAIHHFLFLLQRWLFWAHLLCLFCFLPIIDMSLLQRGVRYSLNSMLAWPGFYPVFKDLILLPPMNVCPYGQVALDIALMLGPGENRGLLLLLAPQRYPELYLRDLCLGKEQRSMRYQLQRSQCSLCGWYWKRGVNGGWGAGLVLTLLSSTKLPREKHIFQLLET